MYSTNRLCNSLQSMVGVFLHASNAPETIINLLSHMGVSVAAKTVTRAIKNLSKEAHTEIRTLGQMFLTSYAYDNLDIDLKHSVPTDEKPQDTLIHITSGTLLPLYDVSREDLDCSEELWKNYHYNPASRNQDIRHISFYDLHDIHPETPHLSELTRRERFNAWKYLSDLINFGPEKLRHFKSKLKNPEPIDPIPVHKTTQVPLRAIDVSPSTPAGNAQALEEFFKQTSIGDSTSDTPDTKAIQNRIVLIFGDLLTGQHVQSLMRSRSVEATPWRRLQFLVFVMGLFHLKMACADALWRIFINHKQSGVDSNSLMAQVSQIRPKETGKIKTNPGFRRMHEIIQHVGIVSRLDVWRLAATKKNPAYTTLEAFAESDPTLEDLMKMSEQIIHDDSNEPDISRMREKEEGERDKQRENTLLRGRYFLLYEELSHAMNYSDIGRVEDSFIPWIYIFRGCGKHKYATEMKRYLENIHFVYPEGLKYTGLLQRLSNG